MGEVVRFISNPERERTRLIQRARAAYESVFPSAESVCTQPDMRTDAIDGGSARRDDEDLPS
jgi:hypothetical protein